MKSNNLSYIQSGFSLIEMAMVMLIMGILLSGLFVSIGQSTTNIRINTTKNQLKEAQEALYGFAQVNGRLPCPATNISVGKANPDDNTGICIVMHGFLPNVTLGLSGSINADGLLLDGWGNPIRYSITGSTNFTSVSGLSDSFDTLPPSADMLTVCDDPADCAATALIDTAPAAIFSMGENWPTYSALSSTLEKANSGNGTTDLLGTYPIAPSSSREFVSTGYSEENFDDIVVWLSPHILFSRLIKAGKLPLP